MTVKIEKKLAKVKHTMELLRLVVPVICLVLQIVILIKVA
jgi:hypothetical protein